MIDFDGIASESIAARRFHGTEMASIVVHGDLNAYDGSLDRMVLVYPVLVTPRTDFAAVSERVRGDRLFVETVHRAIADIVQRRTENGGMASELFAINLSICNECHPFSMSISPLARLLDYMAHRHDLLILVSAGNVSPHETVSLGMGKVAKGVVAQLPGERDKVVLRALHRTRLDRSILSPAESINALTIGAQNHDSTGNTDVADRFSYQTRTLPNVLSRMGLGYNDAVKPDILLPGGRVFLGPNPDEGSGDTLIPVDVNYAGLRAAGPVIVGLESDLTHLSLGTSAATALATRGAHLCYDALNSEDEDGNRAVSVPPDYNAVVVKAMLTHAADWADAGKVIESAVGPKSGRKYVQRRNNVSRFLGFGVPKIDDVLICSESRATLVGYGSIRADRVKSHRIPLPAVLQMSRIPRSVTITIAWLTPVNNRHHEYRAARLRIVNKVEDMGKALGVKRKPEQPNAHVVYRGTVLHAIFRGEDAIQFVDDGHLVLDVYCQRRISTFDDAIKYGIAVTIQSDEQIPIYDQIKGALSVSAIEHASVIRAHAESTSRGENLFGDE